ncbi:MAG: branched-chain amino acid ABC transporter permease [Candidatus Eremiobacteraeota bacterium]|nr:branched-chain amino acid ABC transporter permease [Candidatus Eremiobacteraeota bacterium]
MSADYLLTQAFNGLVNGAYFALLALGLSVIFGMLRIVNFAHGAMFMLGAFVAYYGAAYVHLPFFAALVVAPLVVGLFGLLVEVLFLRRLYALDPLYGLLFTFALVLIIEDAMRLAAGAVGSPYAAPEALSGATNLVFALFPTYRLFVIGVAIVVSAAVWFVLERTSVGARIRAATEAPVLVRALGIDTQRLVSITFAAGVALAALGGVLAAPNQNVEPTMGDKIIINTFAIVVIGGLGSIGGSVLTGFALGLLQTLGAVIFPAFNDTLIFMLMIVVLLVRPSGLFGSPASAK